MLVLSIGVRPAARKLGLPEPTVQAWAARGKWLQPTRATTVTVQPTLQPPPTCRPATVATMQPADALAEILADDERETRISLSRAAKNLASQAESAELVQAGDALQAGKLAALVHRWDASDGKVQVQVNLGFFSGSVG